MKGYRQTVDDVDLTPTRGGVGNDPRSAGRRSYSVGRAEIAPNRQDGGGGRQHSLSPMRLREEEEDAAVAAAAAAFGASNSPLAATASPTGRERRDSRLLHRLGYDAGDTGIDRPPPRDPNNMIPSDFPTVIMFSDDAPQQQQQQQAPPPGQPFTYKPEPDAHQQQQQYSPGGGKSIQSPMARALAESDWPALHEHLVSVERLGMRDKLLLLMDGGAASPTPDDTSSTLLHTAIWKAPPGLMGILLDMLKQDRNDETRQLFLATDPHGNTALHLWCANLATCHDTSILKRLVLGAPTALAVPNKEGDTPLHMFVSSPACCESLRNGRHDNDELVQKAVSVLSYMMDISMAETRIARDCMGATPLHVAIAHGAHEAVLLKLLEEAPAAAKVADEGGMLPLHYAAAHVDHVSPTFVEQLVREHKDGLTHGTDNGDTPLHILVSNAHTSKQLLHQASDELDSSLSAVIELFMGRSYNMMRKDSPVTATNHENLNPLHCCALFDPPAVIARHLMKSPISERAACMENDFGATPLHLAAAQPSVEESTGIIVALGTREAAGTPDRLKRTPLHVASQNVHATRQAIEYLVDLNPDAATIKTQRGHLPLHLAAQSQAKEEVVRALIQAYPKGAEARSKSSNTPLHDAAKYKSSPPAVRALLDSYPDAVYIQNKHGNLPLHCATAYQAPDEVVIMLLEAWPDGASMQNRSQDAPLHFAAANSTRVETIFPLLKAAPAAVLLLNSNGESPMDRAKSSNDSQSDIVRLLEKAAAEWTNKAATDPGFGMFQEDFDGASF